MDMTLEEQGAYRNLLDEAALRGGPLPNDERVLAKACGDALAWKKVRSAVLARFTLQPDGWRNETLDGVIQESARRSDKQRNYRNRVGNAAGNDHGNDQANAPNKDTGNETRPPDPSPDPSPFPSPEPCVPQAPAPIALAGTLPRDLRNQAWISSRGKHVPIWLHAEFKAALGGEDRAADQRLRVFYEAVERGWPDSPIGDEPVPLWRKEFAAKFPSVAPAANQGSKRTAELQRASEEFLKS